jgi:MSHA biogenesis protein MshQ
VNNGELCLYIDNVLQGCSTHNNGEFAIDVDVSGFILGQEQDSLGGDFDSSQAFSGLLDEVLLFDTVLSANDINSIYNNQSQGKNWDGTERSCGNFIDHFEINILDGQGLTCEADDIIIKACADESCSTVNPDAVDVLLSINSAPYKTVTVSGNDGTATSYSFNAVGNAALSLDQDYECKDSSSIPCNVEFSDASFVFSMIDDQVAGLEFSGITIKARKDINGVCTDLLSGNKSVDMALEYIAPSRSTENKYFLSDTPIAKNLLGDVSSYTAIPLNFIVNSTADLGTNKYDDAGQVKLHARYVEPPSGDNSGFTIEGSSNSFWVSPHHFTISATNGSVILNGAIASSTKKQISGEDFSLSFIAKNAGNNPTTNYITQQVQLQLERTGPTIGGGEGTLKYSNNQNISSKLNSNLAYIDATEVVFDLNGEYNFNAAMYNEVGLTKLYIRENGYGTGNYKAKGVVDVGRFIPDHFIQTIEEDKQGSLTANHDNNRPLTCNMIDWVYTGQRTGNEGTIRYLVEPVLTITANNSDGVKTVNYIGDFAKLLNVDNETLSSKNKITFTGPSTVGLPLLGNITGTGVIATASGGVLTYQLPEQHHFIYIRNSASEVAPFDADFELPFSEFKDSDDVTIKPSNGGTDYFQNPHFYQLDANPPDVSAFDNTVEVRFGRWYVENAFGPETSQLPVLMHVQYLKETEFEINTDDNCTLPDIEGEINSGAIWSGGLTDWQYRLLDVSTDIKEPITPDHTKAMAPAPLTAFSNGVYRKFIFSAPGDGNRGSLNFEYQVSPWLQYDWNNDESFTNNPTSTLTFGIFRGNDRIIYQREILP